MCLQSFLMSSFAAWQPSPPALVSRTKSSVTLGWRQDAFSYMKQEMLYRLEKKDELRRWVVEYWCRVCWRTLLEMINSANGYTPLATAALKGDVNMVKLLLSSSADVEGLSANQRTALHVALLAGQADVAALLLDHGADVQAGDMIGLRASHCAVDGGTEGGAREGGGELRDIDDRGWTPLFRAVVGSASTAMIEELVAAGAEGDVAHHAGLQLLAAVRLMRGQSGSRRLSAIRAVDSSVGRELAAENYIRLTRKITTLHTAISDHTG